MSACIHFNAASCTAVRSCPISGAGLRRAARRSRGSLGAQVLLQVDEGDAFAVQGVTGYVANAGVGVGFGATVDVDQHL